MRIAPLAATLTLLLAGCDRGPTVKLESPDGTRIAVGGTQADGTRTMEAEAGNGAVSIRGEGDRLSVKVPGLDAKLSLPGMRLGGDATDIAGIRVHPGTRMDAVDVAGDGAGGTVRMRFADPAAPAALAEHYRRAAQEAGYTLDAAGADRVAAHRDEGGQRQDVGIAIRAEGTGSAGTITVTGR